MRDTMWRQPLDLADVLADDAAVDDCAARLAGRRVLLVGTGTSYHAAHHGAFLLREAGVEAWAVSAFDAATTRFGPALGDAVVVLHHRGWKRYSSLVLENARDRGLPLIVISRRGNADADLGTVPEERSAAFTSSHLAAMLRCAQLARALGAELPLERIPGAVAAALEQPSPGVEPPERLLQFAGTGANAWTAAEGALKIRETAYVAADGLAAEQLLHGPSVALGRRDRVVLLDGGGEGVERLDDLERVLAAHGAPTHRLADRTLPEPLSVFPLTVQVQRIALEAAERLGTDPDSFGRDLPGRAVAWQGVGL